MTQDAIICPRKGKHDPSIGPVAVMVAMEKDLALMRRSMGIQGRATCRILTSNLYTVAVPHQDISLVGPVLGAPYAAMVLEKLIVLGAQKILFFGWCGSLQQVVQISDFVVPDRAVIGEGTSAHYPVADSRPRPSGIVLKAIEQSFKEGLISFHRGAVWSTDAPYRETRQDVILFQNRGVLGVDMELSALFTVARFRQVDIGALLVVSDEIGALRWMPGFSSKRFNRSRKVAAEVIPRICQKMS